ncbi:hypothetical protein HanIR_Chr13g0667531 [Helianthus annuus]|nr:hypothetical protein HanIR_Chr13g0667531 [Helianthus annuus]
MRKWYSYPLNGDSKKSGSWPFSTCTIRTTGGETPALWFAKSQATLNAIYAQLCAQQRPTQVQTQQTPMVTPMPRQLIYETPHQYDRSPSPIRQSARTTCDTYDETESYYDTHTQSH